jgi:hypothetical protein
MAKMNCDRVALLGQPAGSPKVTPNTFVIPAGPKGQAGTQALRLQSWIPDRATLVREDSEN